LNKAGKEEKEKKKKKKRTSKRNQNDGNESDVVDAEENLFAFLEGTILDVSGLECEIASRQSEDTQEHRLRDDEGLRSRAGADVHRLIQSTSNTNSLFVQKVIGNGTSEFEKAKIKNKKKNNNNNNDRPGHAERDEPEAPLGKEQSRARAR
jgi:hypothetical protein